MISIGESCLSSTVDNNRIVSIVKESYDNLACCSIDRFSFYFDDEDALKRTIEDLGTKKSLF